MSSSWPLSKTSDDDILKCVICSRDVVDPVLLACLHSACSSCTGSDMRDSFTCPSCHVTTDASTGKTNLIVSALAHRSLLLKGVFSCTQCSDEGNPDAVAVLWCYTCQQSLCFDCRKSQSKVHSTHNLMNLDGSTNLSELYHPPVRSCKKHQKEFLSACFTCKSGCCFKCAHNCYNASHDVFPLDDSDALKRMADKVTRATRVLSELNTSLTPLQANLNLPERLLSAREESLATLKKAKKTAMDSISDAYDISAESLLDCWDSLLVHALSLREGAECLNRRVSWTNQYCKMALESVDIPGLLPQLDDVVSSLESLLEETRRFHGPVDPTKLIRFKTWLPSDLNLIASSWFGQAKVLSDDLNSSVNDFAIEDNMDYYNRKVSTLEELERYLQRQKQELEMVQRERQDLAKQQSEFIIKDQELAAAQTEVKSLMDQKKDLQDQLEKERRKLEQQQSELTSRSQQLVASQNEVKKISDQLKELQAQLDRERSSVKQLQTDLNLKTQQHVASQNEVKKVHDQQKELQAQLDSERRTVKQLQIDLNVKTQQHATSENKKKKLLDQQQEQQKQLERERRTVEQLQSELKSKTQQLAAPTKPLSFDSKPRGTFKGPGRCWDVAVTSQGSLLVAAMADGLKEYDATSFRETASWKPAASLLGNNAFSYVSTVEALSDGRALVGLNPKLIVLLRSDVVSGGPYSSSAAAGVWRVERCIAAELQGSPRRLSAWDDRLLAVLEDRYDESTKSWHCGPGLVLLSLSDGDKLLHRQKLDYNALSVALTDRGVIVASDDAVELSADAACSDGSNTNKKCCVVDCYSHVGVRLWRYEVGGGGKVMSVCSDSVGRVIYAAKSRGSVVALSVDDGRELSEAITLSTTEIGTLYAIALGKATQHRMVLLTQVGDNPNSINVLAVS